jgi:phage-related minor tail protein
MVEKKIPDVEDPGADATEASKTDYEGLQKNFEKMQEHLNAEINGLHNQLNKRTTGWTDQLKNLSKAGDLLYENLDKQLSFHSKLDKIMEESQKRQSDMYSYFQNSLGSFIHTPEDTSAKKKADENRTSAKEEARETERSILDRFKAKP